MTENEKFLKLLDLMRDGITVLQQIIEKLEGEIPKDLLTKLEALADEAERIRNLK
jgi:hypothetical protein